LIINDPALMKVPAAVAAQTLLQKI
jgi:hypothetical protein